MCVRTCPSNNNTHPDEIQRPVLQTTKSKTTKNLKYKEKYSKKYDEQMEREEKFEKGEINNHDDYVSSDILALIMIKYKIIIAFLARYCKINEKSMLYKVLFTTTQPGHVIMIVAVLSILSVVNSASVNNKITPSEKSNSQIMSFIYLTSFVVHFGSQIWMTFVSGLSLYFALPRHVFNDVQRVLFPRYFTMNACLSFITLLIFVKHHPVYTWDTEIAVQVGGMLIVLFLELFIRLYFTPPLLHLMIEKKAIEFAAGNGNEIGYQNLSTLKHCPHYMKIYKAFRKTHSFIAVGNILTMACTLLHLHYIASKLVLL
ncbi:transmembrane protein 205 [Chelonus insularis]|uniref:transmembrane protein 205 n=1 Tax=Chelonus insularis TaxID=460826 RepID=UPI00158C8A9A|nr:transmembrane protein 205 [Chelonus insularis]